MPRLIERTFHELFKLLVKFVFINIRLLVHFLDEKTDGTQPNGHGPKEMPYDG